MPLPKLDDQPHYQPLPSESNNHQRNNNYIILPIYLPAFIFRQWRSNLIWASTLLLLLFAVYFLWPSDPDLKVVRLHINHIHIRTVPRIALDLTLGFIGKVQNPDLYSMDYHYLQVSVGYRGKQLGSVSSSYGHVRARGSSYINATLELDGVEFLDDVILVLEDLARGLIQLDTVTDVTGMLSLFFIHLPLKTKVSCEIYVNTRSKTISHQSCYPEVRVSPLPVFPPCTIVV